MAGRVLAAIARVCAGAERVFSPDSLYCIRACAVAGVSIFLLLGFEWLFQVTRPSHLRGIEPLARILALAAASVVALTLLLGLLLIALVAQRAGLSTPFAALPLTGGASAIAVITAAMLVTNFSITVFRASPFQAQRWLRLTLAALFVAALVAVYRELLRKLRREEFPFRAATILCVAILTAIVGIAGIGYDASHRQQVTVTPHAGPKPNLLLIGADGVEAERLSIYGYRRPTSPNLEALAREAVVFENAFANSTKTAASTVSLLTGRLPTATRVFHEADLLRGEPYRHLPFILREYGYESAQYSVVDAYRFNLKQSFDLANGRREPNVERFITAVAGLEAGLFLAETWRRHASLVWYLLHPPVRIFDWVGRPHMGFVYAPTNVRFEGRDFSLEAERYDASTIRKAEEFIGAAREPLFLNVFLMGTHGPKFFVNNERHSRAKGRADWDPDRFDDAMAEADANIGRLIEALRRKGILDRTIVVFYSDHGFRWRFLARIPLIIRFPGGVHRRRERANVSLVDVAPTVLGYMGAEIPPWMDGVPVAPSVPECRSVVSVATNHAFYEELTGAGPVSSLAVVRGSAAAIAFPGKDEVTRSRVSTAKACPDAAPEARALLAWAMKGGR